MQDPIQFLTGTYSSTLTRPANTTAYSDGDVFAAVTTNAVFVLGTAWNADAPGADTSVARRGSRTQSGCVDWIELVSSVNPVTKMVGDLFMFTAQPTLVADNAAFAPTLAELQASCVGVFPITADDWHSAGSSRSVCTVPNSSRVFKLPDLDAGGTGQLWFVLVFRAAYTPASGETLTLRASVSRD